MKFCKTKTKGFTIIELVIVVSIIAFLGTLGLEFFQRQQAQMKYDEFVYRFTHMVSRARNEAYIQQLDFDYETDEFKNTKKSFGVYFKTVDDTNSQNYNIILFSDDEDKEEYNDATATLLEEHEAINLLKPLLPFSGIQDTTSIDATPFKSFSIVFQPEPDAKSIISTDQNETLSSFKMTLGHIPLSGGSKLQRLYHLSFDIVSQILNHSDAPVFTHINKTATNTLFFHTNTDIAENIDIKNNLSIEQKNLDGSLTDITGNIVSALSSVNGVTVVINPLPDTLPLRIVYTPNPLLTIKDNAEYPVKMAQMSYNFESAHD